MKVNAWKAIKGHNGPEMVHDHIPAVNIDGRQKGDSPDRIYEVCKALEMDRETEEHLYIFCMDNKLKITAFFQASVGNANSSIMDPRVIMRNALMLNASFIAMAHNHPSGDATPSPADITGTRRIKDAGDLLNVPLVDHIVVGSGYFISIRNDAETRIWQ